MSNTTQQTFREALDEAATRVARARLVLDREEKARDGLIVAALESGASFRDMGRQLGVAPATVLRRYGRKGHADHVSGLDLPAPDDERQAGASETTQPPQNPQQKEPSDGP